MHAEQLNSKIEGNTQDVCSPKIRGSEIRGKEREDGIAFELLLSRQSLVSQNI